MIDRTSPGSTVAIRTGEIRGVLFDMDGVLTDTAVVHAAAWKHLFDEFFGRRDQQSGSTPPRPFEIGHDYEALLDGRLRQDGVRAVLESRGIQLAEGDVDDEPLSDRTRTATVWSLANRKQVLFTQELGRRGAMALPGASELIHRLRRVGVRTGVVSASRNAAAVLRAVGLHDLDVQVDGVDSDLFDLAGKPDPALFLEAARRLDLEPDSVMVFEDAVAGVQAGRAGGFTQVIGVGVAAQHAALLEAGADVCVLDLRAVQVVQADLFPPVGDDSGPWVFEFDATRSAGADADGDEGDEGRREALCTLGNGYMATRGAAPEAVADGVHYPGTYAAGVYNRLVTNVHGHELEHEDLVNLPNWLPLTFRVADGEWFGSPAWQVDEDRYRLDMRHGILTRRVRASDDAGHGFLIDQRRLVSTGSPHLAHLQTLVRLEKADHPVALEIRSAIDGRITNAGVREYRPLNDRHIHVVDTDAVGDSIVLRAQTTQSGVGVGMAARTIVSGDHDRQSRELLKGAGWIAHSIRLVLEPGQCTAIDKTAALYTTRDPAISEPGAAALAAVDGDVGLDRLVGEHRASWERLWKHVSLTVQDGDHTQAVVNLHLFHLMQSLSPRHTQGLDAGVTARGLHGEAYRGHVFWDELFILPYLALRFPELVRSLLMYRYRRLGTARALARQAGRDGALYPWQSGSDGREETPVRLYNVRSGRWMNDNSQRQRHVGLAVAHNLWRYVQTTDDTGFLEREGIEMLVAITRYWASLASFDQARDRYDIEGVMGPDEFHDGYPDKPGEGLVNNTYTNVMASWVLCRTLEAVGRVRASDRGGQTLDRLALRPEELDLWEEISRKLTVEFDRAGRLAQFRGYEDLDELDWDRYRRTYGNIGRLDLILESEGDSTNRYQLSKQADVLMLFYLFSAEEVTSQLAHLGYDFDPATIPATVEHYLARTSHGSTLCRVAHSWVLARTDRAHSWRLFLDALASDISDTQGGTTGEGIHLGAMAGTVDLLQRCYSGLEIADDGIVLNPQLPEQLRRLRFRIVVRGHAIEIHIEHSRVILRSRSLEACPLLVTVQGRSLRLDAGAVEVVPTFRVPAPEEKD